MKKYYDEGWNARVRGEPYDSTATRDWRDGWKDCDEAPEESRKIFEILVDTEVEQKP